MKLPETLPERLQRALSPTHGGVAELTEQLLSIGVGGDVEFERIGDHCVCRSTGADITEEIRLPFPPAAFRTILACVASLCNARKPGTVSPYGGEGDLVIGAESLFVKFRNTTQAQKLEVSTESRNSASPPNVSSNILQNTPTTTPPSLR